MFQVICYRTCTVLCCTVLVGCVPNDFNFSLIWYCKYIRTYIHTNEYTFKRSLESGGHWYGTRMRAYSMISGVECIHRHIIILLSTQQPFIFFYIDTKILEKSLLSFIMVRAIFTRVVRY